MLFSDNSRVIMHGLMILLHFAYDVGEYMALRFPVFSTGVLAAFILAQVIFRSSCRALHIRTWRLTRTQFIGVLITFRREQHSLHPPDASGGKARMKSYFWCPFSTSQVLCGVYFSFCSLPTGCSTSQVSCAATGRFLQC